MQKFKTFAKQHVGQIIFSVMFILLLGFLALPYLCFEIPVGEDVFEYVNVSIYQLMSGGNFTYITLQPDVTIILSFIFILVGAILYYATLLIKKDNVKKGILATASFLFFIALFFFIALNKFIKTYDYLDGAFESVSLVNLGYIFDVICLLALLVLSTLEIFGFVKYTTKDLAEIGILIAAALVLDKIKIPVGATGGSINLAGLPLFVIALRHGPLKGFIAASIIFGLISCLIDGYGLQTFPFDYFIAFSGYAVTGLIYNLLVAGERKIYGEEPSKGLDLGYIIFSLIVGSLAVTVTRMIGSSISSYIYFIDYLPEDILAQVDDNKFAAILIYNALYIIPSAFFSMIGAIILAKPIQIINKRFPIARNVKEK